MIKVIAGEPIGTFGLVAVKELDPIIHKKYEDNEEGTYYFNDTYNTDFIWRMGYGLMGVRIMVACGGPNIWVDTFEKAVHGYWGGSEAIAYLTNDCCEKIEKEFDDYTVREMIYNDGD